MEDINIPVKPWFRWDKMEDETGVVGFKVKLVCPTCHYKLERVAPRCPECGQLFKEGF